MKTFNVGILLSRAAVESMKSELKRNFKAQTTDIKNTLPQEPLTNTQMLCFSVTVEDNLKTEAEKYCRSQFSKELLQNNQMPNETGTTGIIY